MKKLRVLLLTILLGLLASSLAQVTVRVGLGADPDILDPDLGRTLVGRIVFASLCDKLFEITPDLQVVPQLATGYEVSEDGLTLTIRIRQGVVFHDGTPLNAEAVKFNLDRSLNLPGSLRRSEIQQISSVEAVDNYTVQVNLSEPFAPLIAQLADRAGMMISPTAAKTLGEQFGASPVCAGPFKFVSRVALDRIVLERFADYWDAERIKIDRVIFLPIPDASVRLVNLRAGDLDLIEGVATTDLNLVRADPNLELISSPSLAYQGLTINLANPAPRDHPLATDVRVREALDLSLDRNAINQVVFDGQFLAGNQPHPPTSPWYIADYPMVARDVERAKALLAEAGHTRVAFELIVVNNPVAIRVGEVIQIMAAEAGFDISLRPTEFVTALDLQTQGTYDVFQVGWSGRIDPDGNIHQFHTCEGTFNFTGYCDDVVTQLLNEARTTSDPTERLALYREAALRFLPNRHIIYLYHPQLFFAHTNRLRGFEAYPDGLIRFQGVTLN